MERKRSEKYRKEGKRCRSLDETYKSKEAEKMDGRRGRREQKG